MRHSVSFVAHRMQVQVHQHRCYQILLSLDAPFSSVIEGKHLHGQYGLIINQNIPHACQALGGRALVYFIDSHSDTGALVRHMLEGKSFINIQSQPTHVPWRIAGEGASAGATKSDWQKLANQCLDGLLAASTGRVAINLDKRIASAIDFVIAHLDAKLSLQDVAAHINLSIERTRHLFAQESGTSFSQFMLWQRLKQSIQLIAIEQMPLTQAAVHTGFADQAHFCRTFRRTFGVAPSSLLKNSRFVQFIYP